jgi:hypothetical protein
MKRFGLALGVFVGALATTLYAAPPQGESRVSGEITIEDTAQVKRNPYQAGQDAAIDYFNNADRVIATLARGESAAPGSLPDGAINHLLGVYLYCTVRAGACPFILDAVLEIDIIDSRIAGTAACPTMERFWRAWIRDDMEKRLKYLVRTANLDVTAQFARVERPRYLKCRETVATEIGVTEGAPLGPVGTYFTRRYSDMKGPRAKISKLAKLLVELKAKIPDTIAAAEAAK